MIKSVRKFKQNMAKSHKSCMEQAEIIDTFETYHTLIEFIRDNEDIFAWKPSDMPGVPRELAEHCLNTDPKLKPVKQFLRRFNDERRDAIGEEIARLLAVGFIMEVFYPEWLANPVHVLNKNGTWRLCIDYTDLNKAFPKDPFALPHIDQIIDSTAGCELLCFLDAYYG